MVNDLFDGTKGFAIDGGIKDSTHIRKLAGEMNCPLPALVIIHHFVRDIFVILTVFTQDTAHQHLLTARALHESKKAHGEPVYETLDWSSLVAGTRVAAGLDGFDSSQVYSFHYRGFTEAHLFYAFSTITSRPCRRTESEVTTMCNMYQTTKYGRTENQICRACVRSIKPARDT